MSSYGYEYDDGVHLGNTEIGESLRGLQRTEIGAAAKLQGLLGQIAQGHFGPHQPLQKTLRSPYKDSTQFGVDCSGNIAPAAWTGTTSYPTVTGSTRMYKSFKPMKAIADESLIVTFTNASGVAVNVAVDIDTSGDLILIAAFAGADNCFPTAPNQSTGLSGKALAFNSLGTGISWPTINGGIDLTITFAVKQTALFRAAPPAGYTTADITNVQVLARLNFFGTSLR